MKTLLLSSSLIFTLIIFGADVRAAESRSATTNSRPAAARKEAKARPLPFNGNIGTVDTAANTIKVGRRIFHVTAETKVLKNGQKATLKEAAPGDEVGGSYRDENGELKLISLRIGPKPK